MQQFFGIHDSKITVKGYSSVVFKGLSAKWCAAVCLPYPAAGETDAVIINSDGLVWCNESTNDITHLIV